MGIETKTAPIDRYRLVTRHNPHLFELCPNSPLTVGNGEFAFTADVTGLQTFPESYMGDGKTPLCTMSQWGWHSNPAPRDEQGREKKELKMEEWDVYGRKVGFASGKKGQEDVFNWLRENPHKMHLGRIGFKILLGNGERASASDIGNIDQELDMWRGIITSRFSVEGVPVTVKTCCHPSRDIIAVSVDSPLIKESRLFIEIEFPYGSPNKYAADFKNEAAHTSRIVDCSKNSISILRQLDEDSYFFNAAFSENCTIKQYGKHLFTLSPLSGDKIELVSSFTQCIIREPLPAYANVEQESIKYWESFWSNGGIVELAESKDPRALELERRIILSQYLMAIQCAGSLPPQETGLTCNSWYGKFHLEMHWWHAAHFPLWGRSYLLERSMWWYHYILDRSKAYAEYQGYTGARWPKMCSKDNLNSPSPIGVMLIWQQPHPIMFAELCYRANPTKETLLKYSEIVFESAEFMASYAVYDKENDRFVLGPPLAAAQESLAAGDGKSKTMNPTFELAYWRYGLEVAQEWRKRLGLPANPKWEEVRSKLPPLPVVNGLYTAAESCPDTFPNFMHDHPTMLGAFGILNDKYTDKEIMLNTLKKVLSDWEFEKKSWGWDFPMVAMTAARLGEPSIAVDALLMDISSNVYLKNGHNTNLKRPDLPLYLPGNGALLIAVAMMCAGWEGCPPVHAPGFPQDGSWNVKFEGLNMYP